MLYALLAITLVLTWAMFHTKNMMLGFPCVMFWAITGGYCYTQSTTTWDIWYLLFFASTFGMTIFCAIAMYGLRTKKEEQEEGDQLIDEGKDETQFIDEGEPEEDISRQVRKVRDNADRRRTKGIRRPPRL